jgi:hypothetical protein
MDFIKHTYPPPDIFDHYPLFDFNPLKTTRRLLKDFTWRSTATEIELTQTKTIMNDYCTTFIIHLLFLIVIAMYLIAFTQGLWWPAVK